MDVEEAIDELTMSSFVETTTNPKDEERFLSVPLVTAIFGQRKLAASPMKLTVESDVALLKTFGAVQKSDIQHGLSPRVGRVFRYVAGAVSRGEQSLDDHLPVLQFLATNYPPAWLLLASLYEELGGVHGLARAQESLRSFLEVARTDQDRLRGWELLARLCRHTGDVVGEAQALVELARLPGVGFDRVSEALNRVNSLTQVLREKMYSEDLNAMLAQLARTAEARVSEASATDCSRMAWLFMNLHEKARAID
jgi:hypothetical protein